MFNENDSDVRRILDERVKTEPEQPPAGVISENSIDEAKSDREVAVGHSASLELPG